MPNDFFTGIIERAKRTPKRACLPESASADVVALAQRIDAEGLGPCRQRGRAGVCLRML